MSSDTARPLLVTGATGTLGYAFRRICESRGIPTVVTRRSDLDICDPYSVARALARIEPWAVVNTAGYVRVDDAEHDAERCRLENVEGPGNLARAAVARDLPLVTFSTDLVFDGTKRTPYLESDPVAPLNVYGRTKTEAEALVLEAHPASLVVRTAAFFGPWDEYNFVAIALRELAAGRPMHAATDSVVSPTYVPDLVHATLDLLLDSQRGVWHLANEGAATWAGLASMAAEAAGIDASTLRPRPLAPGLTARRPAYSALGSERGPLLPRLELALARYASERAAVASA